MNFLTPASVRSSSGPSVVGFGVLRLGLRAHSVCLRPARGAIRPPGKNTTLDRFVGYEPSTSSQIVPVLIARRKASRSAFTRAESRVVERPVGLRLCGRQRLLQRRYAGQSVEAPATTGPSPRRGACLQPGMARRTLPPPSRPRASRHHDPSGPDGVGGRPSQELRPENRSRTSSCASPSSAGSPKPCRAMASRWSSSPLGIVDRAVGQGGGHRLDGAEQGVHRLRPPRSSGPASAAGRASVRRDRGAARPAAVAMVAAAGGGTGRRSARAGRSR